MCVYYIQLNSQYVALKFKICIIYNAQYWKLDDNTILILFIIKKNKIVKINMKFSIVVL